MQSRNPFQANKAEGHYPVVPSTYPNRIIRRTLKHRAGKLPQVWVAFFAQFPNLADVARRLA